MQREEAEHQSSSGHPRLSVLIPLYNEALVFSELYARLCAVAQGLPRVDFEFVFVDDGSSDTTWELVLQAQENDQRIRALSLSRNFGQQTAYTAGLDIVSGDAAVLMDGDLQDDPTIIKTLLEKYNEGFDVVSVRRSQREAAPHLKFAYLAFYRLFRMLSPVEITADSGDFAILSRRVIDSLRQMPERHRFLRGLRAWVGYRQTSISVERPARFSGQSKFTVRKLCTLAIDGILSFSVVPIRLAAISGLAIVLFAVLMSVYALYIKLVYDASPTGFTALMVFVCLIGGANLLFLGILGEYIGRVYEQSKQRPLYLLKDSRGVPKDRYQHQHFDLSA